MKLSRTLLCALGLTILATTAAQAADLRPTLSRTQPSYSVSKTTIPAPLEVNKIFENNCETQGFQCAGGYSCELIMTLSGEDARGERVSMSGTNQRFYTCKISGRTDWPTCSKGMTPTGRFVDGIGRDLRRIPGGVREYTCQIAL